MSAKNREVLNCFICEGGGPEAGGGEEEGGQGPRPPYLRARLRETDRGAEDPGGGRAGHRAGGGGHPQYRLREHVGQDSETSPAVRG